ncbi:MAG TPA: FtsX-like permease family protein [Gemmatimonadota bacterium]|nr:FtsX-like permease family protein [Gemmatimonadota bacterium]
MILRCALREPRRHPGRTLLAVAGVAVSGAMLLDMLMLSNGLQTSFRDLLQDAGYEVRVSPAGTLPLDTEATIRDATRLLADLRDDPGVARVAPVLAANLSMRADPTSDGEAERSVFALGVDPANQGVFRVTGGRIPGPGEILLGEEPPPPDGGAPSATADSVSIAAFGALGSGAGAGARRMPVSGSGKFLYVSESEVPVALELGTLQELTDRPNEVSFVMVEAAPGIDPDTLATRLATRHPDVRIVSIGELVDQAERRLSYFRQLAVILGTVSLLVAGLLVGTIASVSISDRYGTIAAARAIGISRRSILATLLIESLAQSAVAVALGVAFGLVTSRYLERILSDFPGLPEAVRFFVPDGRIAAITVAAVLVTAALAALGPAWRVTRMPIATTLHREEP